MREQSSLLVAGAVGDVLKIGCGRRAAQGIIGANSCFTFTTRVSAFPVSGLTFTTRVAYGYDAPCGGS
eukprot:2161563-Prymnesium_polylepis.3